jgi:hypothetical protein
MNAKGNGSLEDPSNWPSLRAPVQKSLREEFLQENAEGTEELRAGSSSRHSKSLKLSQ